MELKEFVKNVLRDLVDAVEETRKGSSRDMILASHKESGQTIEFDIAVTVEENTSGSGRAGIRVFSFIDGGGGLSHAVKNASISRIKFGVRIEESTKEEIVRVEQESQYQSSNDSYSS